MTTSLDPRIQPEVVGLDFPVLLVGKDSLRVYPGPEALTASLQKAVEQRVFSGAAVVDSAGHRLAIRKVRILGTIGPFFGLDWYLHRNVRVAFDFAEPQIADLEQIRSAVLREWRRASRDFGADYAVGYRERLRQAVDLRALISILAEQYQVKLERTH